MKIPTRIRYGARIMVRIADYFENGKPVLLRTIAQEEHISEKYISQIITPLKAKGLVRSFRGAHGGYMMAHDPSEITMRQVFEALDDGFDLVECMPQEAGGALSAICVVRMVWDKLGQTMAEMLEGITLQDLVSDMRKAQALKHDMVPEMYYI